MKYLLTLLLLLCLPLLAQQPQEGQPTPFQYQEPPKADPLQLIFDTGKRAFSERLYDASIRYFTEYLEKVGNNLELFTQGADYLAQSWLLNDNPQKALEVITTLEKKLSSPLSPSFLYLKARALAKLSKWQEAYDTLAHVILSSQQSTLPQDATLLCADCLMEQRKWEEMELFITRINAISESARGDFQLQYRLAEAQIALQKYQLAMDTISNVQPPQQNEKEKLKYDIIKVRILSLLNQVDKAMEEFANAKLATSATSTDTQQQMWQMFLALADSLYTAKRYDEAIPIYQRAIGYAADDEQKKHSMEYVIRSYIAVKFNKDELIKSLETFGQTFPASQEEIELTELYAQSLYNEKNYYEAIERFKKLCLLNPEQDKLYAAYMNIGKCYRFQGETNNSIEAFEKAEPFGKDEEERANALFQAADMAADFFHKSLQNSQEKEKIQPYATAAITIFKRVATQYPKTDNAPLALFKEANILYALDEFKKAAGEYAIITSNYQTSDKYEEALLLQGMCMRRYAASPAEKTAANHFLAESATQMTPDSPFIDWANLEAAQAAEEAGNVKLAETMLMGVANNGTSEKNKEALFSLAMLQFNASDDEDARKNTETFFEKYPTDPLSDELCIMIGDSYANEGNWEMAAKYYITPLNTTPVRNPIITPYARYESANAAFHLERFNDALDHLTTLIATLDSQKQPLPTQYDPNLLARASFLKGDTHAKLLEYANAADAFSTCFREAQDSNLKYSALGRRGEMLLQIARKGPISEHTDDFRNAEQCFREIIRQEGIFHPLNIMARYFLAFTLNCQDKTEEAIKEYEDFYTSFGEKASHDTPVDNYYFANAILELAELLEKDEKNPDRLKKAQHYYAVLMKANLPTSPTAKERYIKLMNTLK